MKWGVRGGALIMAPLVLFTAGVEAQQHALTLPAVKVMALDGFLREIVPQLLSARSDHFQLKYIEPDAQGAKAGWGIDYDWKLGKSSAPSATPENGQSFTIRRMTSELAINGSYAFGDTRNNQDLSTVKAVFSLERGDFGELSVLNADISDAFMRCLNVLPAPLELEDVPAYDRESRRCVEANGIEDAIRVKSKASYYSIDFQGGIEGNQDYSRTHTVFGLMGTYALQPAESAARLNIFDAPFRLLRKGFSGLGDEDFVAPWPSLLIGLDRVEADEDDPRSALTDDETYTRAKGEIAFNTQIANFGGQTVRFNVSWRYYKELSAPAAVKAAELDEFEFVTASLRFPASMLPMIPSDDYEFYVGYTSGKLPFGVESDTTYEIGISTNFQTLADFLAAR